MANFNKINILIVLLESADLFNLRVMRDDKKEIFANGHWRFTILYIVVLHLSIYSYGN